MADRAGKPQSKDAPQHLCEEHLCKEHRCEVPHEQFREEERIGDSRTEAARNVTTRSVTARDVFSNHSNSVLRDYRIIGTALLRLERDRRNITGLTSSWSLRCFREDVAFVSVSVLESYLEDLLDVEVTDERLCIATSGWRVRLEHLSALGLLGALACGLRLVSSGGSLVGSFLLTLVLALPAGILWHLAPRNGLARRVSFAQIVSQEIFRRRGIDRDGSAPIRPRLSELLVGNQRRIVEH